MSEGPGNEMSYIQYNSQTCTSLQLNTNYYTDDDVTIVRAVNFTNSGLYIYLKYKMCLK